jgi:hypothetical protein
MTPLVDSKPITGMANSEKAIRRFPFPFLGDSYMYSVNLVPAGRGVPGAYDEFLFDIDEHYLVEAAERKRILAEDHGRRYATLPHMMDAQWDFLEMAMENLSAGYPQHFALERNGNRWRWTNRLLGNEEEFVFGDRSSLAMEPFEYIGRQMQGDFCLLDQREDDLYLDAGLVTFPADWSLRFDLGMSFEHWHGPVPIAHGKGVFTRAKRFLMNLTVDQPWQRFNWTLTVNRRLDTSPEIYHLWGPDRTTVTVENAGHLVHLRVEVQVLARLARSNGVLFSIRTYLISLEELASNPAWACRLHRVLARLPEEIADYKGLSRYRATAVEWLRAYDGYDDEDVPSDPTADAVGLDGALVG